VPRSAGTPVAGARAPPGARMGSIAMHEPGTIRWLSALVPRRLTALRMRVGAENRVTAFDECLHRRDLAVTGCRPPSTIAGRALRLDYLTLARVLSWLALLARSTQRRTSRSWCSGTRVATSPRQSTPRAVEDRPSPSQRAEQAAAHPAASASACLAPGPCCAGTPNSLPAAGPTHHDEKAAHPAHSPSDPAAADGPRESQLGLPTHSR
jgi:hypothetical protein